jgi:hypothetical protein
MKELSRQSSLSRLTLSLLMMKIFLQKLKKKKNLKLKKNMKENWQNQSKLKYKKKLKLKKLVVSMILGLPAMAAKSLLMEESSVLIALLAIISVFANVAIRKTKNISISSTVRKFHLIISLLRTAKN